MLKVDRIHHVALIVSDYAASRRFYVEVLGLEVLRENYRPDRGDWKLDLKLGEIELEIFGIPGRPPRPSYPEANGLRHLAFHTDCIEETVAELTEKGVRCEPIRVDEFSHRKFTFFQDPDGLPLELHE